MASSRVVEPYLWVGSGAGFAYVYTHVLGQSAESTWRSCVACLSSSFIYILCICILIHPSGLQSLFKYLIVGSSAQATGTALYVLEAGWAQGVWLFKRLKKKSVKKLKLNAACQFYCGGFPLNVFTLRSSTECDGHGGEGSLGSRNRQLPLRLPCGLISS